MRNIITVIIVALVFSAFASSVALAGEPMQLNFLVTYVRYNGNQIVQSASGGGTMKCPKCGNNYVVFTTGSGYPQSFSSLPASFDDITVTGSSRITSGTMYTQNLGEYTAHYSRTSGDWYGGYQITWTFDTGLDTLCPNPACAPCSCGACCMHRCTCGGDAGTCTGTGGAGGCACHVGHGLCEACCACKCEGGTGPQPHEPCDGLPGSCECHADLCNCGACCIHYCTCGLKTTPCNGTTGDGGCSCHENDDLYCNCGACCECKCKVGKKHKKSCLGHCEHNCPEGCYVNEDYQQHCECHHEEGDGHDPNGGGDGDCCEHHKKPYKGHGVQKPDFGLPGFNADGLAKPIPLPGLPGNPDFSSPGSGGDDPKEWRFLKRTEDGFPTLDHEKLFEEVSKKFSEKIPLGEVLDRLGNMGGGSWAREVVRIDTDVLGIGGLGIVEIDLDPEHWFGGPMSYLFRLLLLVIVGVHFMLNIVQLFNISA